MSTPQLLSRKANGHPSVASSQSGADPSSSSKTSKAKAPAEGEKVLIRRLPPGMTEEEFTTILGDTWKASNGKVGWFRYEKGKISTDPAKPSRPARAYLHVLRRDDLMLLSEAIRSATWEDAKESYNSPSLVGPPTVEFSIYKKIPSGKRRTDGRQGTIDQDPEFMAFLESLANPDAQKDGDGDRDTADEADKGGKVKSTPLIESLREKKANRAKEAAAAKSAKHSRHDSQGKAKTNEDAKKKGDRSSDKPKETVKILSKKAATEAAAEAAKNVGNQLQTSLQKEQAQDTATKSRRAGIAAAARILQRDLGLSPGNAHRKARLDAAKAESDAKTAADKASASSGPVLASPTTAGSTTPVAPKAQSQQSATTPATSSSLTGRRGRRGRGGVPGEDTPNGNANKPSESTPSAAEKKPVILLKKKDEGKSSPSPTTLTLSTTSKPPPSGPKGASTTSTVSQKQPAAQTKRPNSAATSTPGATRAFVKHANPSQGVTEALLKQAMQTFGGVSSVEIDRRKGFAYVDFSEASALAKAIAASPVRVEGTEANVVVLERKEKEAAPGGRGGRGGGKAQAQGPVAGVAVTCGSSTAGPVVEAAKDEVGKGSEPSTPTAGAAGAGLGDKDRLAAAASGEKRGGRRRGGRGRGGEGGRKDSPAGAASGTASGTAAGPAKDGGSAAKKDTGPAAGAAAGSGSATQTPS